MHPKYKERTRLWTEHNSLQRTRPLILASCGRYAAYEYELIKYECVDPIYRNAEFQLRHKLFKDWVDDDSVLQPWVQVHATFTDLGWGVNTRKASDMNEQTASVLARANEHIRLAGKSNPDLVLLSEMFANFPDEHNRDAYLAADEKRFG